MKRIAIFCYNLFANGTVKIALTQAEILQEAGQEVHLFIFNPGGDFIPPTNVNIHYVFDENNLSLKSQQTKLQHYVREQEKITGPFSLFLSNSTDCDLIVSGCDFTPCYYFCHCALKQELLMELKRGPFHFFRRWKKAKALIGKNIITVSNGIADELKNTTWLKPKSVQAIYNPFKIDTILAKSKLEIDEIPVEPYMIHIGRVTRQKRLDILFQTIKLMPNAPKLVLLTNRPKRALKLAEKYGVADRIITPGFQENPYAWIARAQIMLLSSDFEGLPTVLIESLICKTPVVSTDCPHGPNEILTGKLSQYLVPRREPKLLAEKALVCLQSLPDVSQAVILEKVKSDYIANQYLALCEK
ncbi:glycosyltransferase [Shewanella surugensis]|uniref:Glycosyltransferase n=1 Tax=Shewanella surugensis TaxID=212020 RepID=A0ABT0LA97_9GAMM|nr:glycosyltransferase [Shewanella surugensis]MCL1124410.1 glycosyltransferase [Shewanella surugensis]